jgi:hypothetical protein
VAHRFSRVEIASMAGSRRFLSCSCSARHSARFLAKMPDGSNRFTRSNVSSTRSRSQPSATATWAISPLRYPASSSISI